MNRLNKFLKRLLIVALCAVAFYYLYYPTCTFRYRLTAEVMTPDGIKTGSSVIEVSYSSTTPLPNPGWWRADTVTGEAVYVDLGKGKNLFITLRDGESGRPHSGWQIPFPDSSLDEHRYDEMDGALDALWLPIKMFRLGRSPGLERDMSRRLKQYVGTPPREIPLNNLPTVVSFRDLSDPDSVEIVQPGGLAEKLGAGFDLKRTTIQIVDEPVSRAIESTLLWLPQIKQAWEEDFSVGINDPLIRRLNYDAFKQPINWGTK